MRFLKLLPVVYLLILFHPPLSASEKTIKHQVIKLLRAEIIARADKALYEKPLTITAFPCDRSAGSIHDFYSEGDYWWPDLRILKDLISSVTG